MTQCKATTKKGAQCKRSVKKGLNSFCPIHSKQRMPRMAKHQDRHRTATKRPQSSDAQRIRDWLRLDKMQLVSLFGSQLTVTSHLECDGASSGHVVFISYARLDEAVVVTLYDQLKQSGFTPWMDVKDIYPGEDWRHAIDAAIQRADFFVLCLSENSLGRRGYLQREIKSALDRLLELLVDDIFFIPVRLTNCEPPKEMSKFQTVDIFKSGGYEKLISALAEGAARRRSVG